MACFPSKVREWRILGIDLHDLIVAREISELDGAI